jgi:dienelactone hydrolase
MTGHLLIAAHAVAIAVGATVPAPSISAAQTPPMAGGYTNVIPIPIQNDPQVKAIAGALFKPDSAGPFPAVIYMNSCAALDFPPALALQMAVINHALSKGFAALIVDPFTPRGEANGICDEWARAWAKGWNPVYEMRGAGDVWAAFKFMSERSDIDPKRIFIEGEGYGADSAAFATASPAAVSHGVKPAGVIAYYAYCGYEVPSVPILFMIGEKDTVEKPSLCESQIGKANVEVVIYPGATHGFAAPGLDITDSGGAHLIYDEKAAKDAEARADAFIAAHMK